MIGTTVGTYAIEALLGEGGMGAVYRARDTKLGRRVAIKVLPDDVAADPDRIARFEREARALAALNHPRIATLYGMEHVAGRHFLVMELVEGETLAERLQRGPLGVEQTLALALQVAEGLEAAHEAGIVHRDLKPANVKVTPDETIKILDFGLARAIAPAEAGAHVPGVGGAHVPGAAGTGAPGLTNSPTLSLMATGAGMILGTAAYMSPEQAKGHPADHRSDIFSFGVVLYEMLAGRQPFHGETAPEIMASVLVRDVDLAALPANINPRLRDLVGRSLQKNPKRRWQAVGDVRYELEAIAAAPRGVSEASVVTTAAPQRPLWQRLIPLGAIAAVFAVAGAGAAWWLRMPAAQAPPVTRFQIALPETQTLTRGPSIALSPDGTQLAYVADGRIYWRSMSDFEARPVPGTDLDPFRPFFSPDGQSIGFFSFTDSTLKRIAVGGGPAQTICRTAVPVNGADWFDDTIVYAEPGRGIMRVSQNGGEPEVIVAVIPPEVPEGPQMLDRETVLFSVATEPGRDRWNRAQIVIQSLTSGERTVVLQGGVGRYVPSGHLVYAVEGIALAAPFDLERRTLDGTGVPVIEGVRRTAVPSAQSGTPGFAVSASGVLAYHPGAASAVAPRKLVIADRSGMIDPLPLPENVYTFARVSPKGDRLAVQTGEMQEGVIWIYDMKTRAPLRRLTFRPSAFPIWTPDGRFITFSATEPDQRGIFRVLADGSGAPERLTQPDASSGDSPESWSRDGRTLSFRRSVAGRLGLSVWTLTLGESAPRRLDETISATHLSSSFSPDGRWIAYSSTETSAGGAQPRVFVQPFPATGAKYQVVATLSASPAWSPDGKELFYDDGASTGRLMVVPVNTSSGFSIGNPVPIQIRGLTKPSSNWRPYDVLPDGRVVVFQEPGEFEEGGRGGITINLVLNWFEELKARVPVSRR